MTIDFLKPIIEKLKTHELATILLIASSILTLLSEKQLEIIGLGGILKYEIVIGIVLLLTISYFAMIIIFKLIKHVRIEFLGPKRCGMRYLKKDISQDELNLLVSTFYEPLDNSFRSCGVIEYSDGRKAALETCRIIYRASSVSRDGLYFSYNLQPYARKYLNGIVDSGKLPIEQNMFKQELV